MRSRISRSATRSRASRTSRCSAAAASCGSAPVRSIIASSNAGSSLRNNLDRIQKPRVWAAMKKLTWTLAALASLGGNAIAEDDSPAVETSDVIRGGGGSHRGVAQDYLVAPSGGELSAQMRFLMTEESV